MQTPNQLPQSQERSQTSRPPRKSNAKAPLCYSAKGQASHIEPRKSQRPC